MTCPRHDPRAPLYTCWQRIPDITDHMEIVRCQQCPHGRALIATVKRQPDADTDMAGAVEAPPQEEIIMEAQTYSVPKLAELLGVEARHIYNARASEGIPSSGSMMGIVLDGMRKRGITWDHVVTAPKGGGKPRIPKNVPPAETVQDAMRKVAVTLKQIGAGVGGSKAALNDAQGPAEGSAATAEGQQLVAGREARDIKPATRSGVIMLDELSLDSLVAALRAKMPANTSITISN